MFSFDFQFDLVVDQAKRLCDLQTLKDDLSSTNQILKNKVVETTNENQTLTENLSESKNKIEILQIVLRLHKKGNLILQARNKKMKFENCENKEKLVSKQPWGFFS